MVNQEIKTEMKKQEATKERESEAIAEAKAKLEKPKINVEDDKSAEQGSVKENKPEIVEEKTSSDKSESIKNAEKEIVEKITKAEDKLEKNVKEIKKGAIVNGKDLKISTKHSIAICNYIKNKGIDTAILRLIEVEKMKKPVPMRGEIPHKKGIMSGRYPVNAAKEFIKLLKSLKSNAIVNELELEKYKLACMPNLASRPYRRGGRMKFKRTHVQLKLIPRIKEKK